MQRADIIVIGAGVLGTFHALFAAQRGLRTLLLERNPNPAAASTRNFGMMPRTIVDSAGEWAGLAQSSAEIYRSIQQQHDISVVQTGSLYLASTPLESRVLAEYAEQFGDEYRCTYLESAAVLARYPFVQSAYCVGGLLSPDDLSLDPRRMLTRLIPYLTEILPITYCAETQVAAIERSGDGCVVTDASGARYQADRVFLCNGTEWRTLFPEVFRSSGLRRCKLQMLRTVRQPGLRLGHSILSGTSIRRYPGFASCPSHAALREDRLHEDLRAYDIHVLIKQAPDGTLVIGDSHEYQDWPGDAGTEETTDCHIASVILDYAGSMLRLQRWDIASMWNGYYLIHPTDPIFTATVDQRIHIVTGIGGKGMTTGPGFARRHVESTLG